jgi:hypothetical protein
MQLVLGWEIVSRKRVKTPGIMRALAAKATI